MAAATRKARCITCGKERSTARCAGCSQDFCFDHLADHRRELSTQLDEVEVHRDLFRQTLTEQTTDPQKIPLIKQIDRWEKDSIQKIQQTAKECRQLLLHHTTGHINQIEIDLTKLTNQIRQIRQENDVNETDLSAFREKLTQLTKELAETPNVSIQEDSATLINKISVVTSESKYAIYY